MHYTMRETASKLKLSAPTLRYYEKEGLLPFQKRLPSGIRYFDDSDICWLELICCLGNSGMPIKTIRQFMLLCLTGEEAAEEKRNLLLEHRSSILERIACLEESLCTVNYKLDHYREIGTFHIDSCRPTQG